MVLQCSSWFVFASCGSEDTNLILLRLLLGLRWQNDGWAQNAVAPGGQLIFELNAGAQGHVVSVFFQVAKPEQLRSNHVFSPLEPPSRVQAWLLELSCTCLRWPLRTALGTLSRAHWRLAPSFEERYEAFEDAFKQMLISKLRPECIGIPGGCLKCIQIPVDRSMAGARPTGTG